MVRAATLAVTGVDTASWRAARLHANGSPNARRAIGGTPARLARGGRQGRRGSGAGAPRQAPRGGWAPQLSRQDRGAGSPAAGTGGAPVERSPAPRRSRRRMASDSRSLGVSHRSFDARFPTTGARRPSLRPRRKLADAVGPPGRDRNRHGCTVACTRDTPGDTPGALGRTASREACQLCPTEGARLPALNAPCRRCHL